MATAYPPQEHALYHNRSVGVDDPEAGSSAPARSFHLGNPMQYFVEVRSTQQRSGRPQLVPLSEVHKYTGFRSVYAFPPDLAERIRQTGSTKDLRGASVYSDTLFMDFDNSDGSATIAYLQGQGIGFSVYSSGARSIHLHIPIEPLEGPDVPGRQKAWVKQHAPDADCSIYHAAAIFRLPRTYHAKTGRPKILVATYSGVPLVVPDLSQHSRKHPVFTVDETSPEKFYFHLLANKGEGKRRPHMFLLATIGLELGLDVEVVREHLVWWNERQAAPHPTEVIDQQLMGAVTYVGRQYRRVATN